MGIDRHGSDSRRKITNSGIGYDQEISDLRRASPKSIFYRAVIVEILNDLSRLTDEKITEIKSTVTNPGLVHTAPRNSAIVRVVSGARDRKGSDSNAIICYPFMPPYLALPAKAGEQVWVMFENEDTSTALGYWLWRIPEPNHIDDMNYTHGDRKFTQLSQQSTSEKADTENSTVPDFPNGGGTSENWSLKKKDDYETIVDSSESYEDFTPEAIPRFTKRPGDAVLQGSNNTLIVLGEDRTGPASGGEERSGAGMIDMVVGRGTTESTEAFAIENTRGNQEVDKNPAVSGGQENSQEGDPDLVNDAARLLAAMKTDGDTNLGLAGNYPEPFDSDASTVDESSYVIAKANEVRVIARVDGSVRIVKEGTVGEDQSAILMLSDGTVRIDGNVIYIGRPGGDGPGKSGAEPYIKYSKYESQMTELIDVVNGLMEVFIASFAIPNPPVVGGPTPALTTVLSNPNGPTAVIAQLEALKAKLAEAKSSRIFGE